MKVIMRIMVFLRYRYFPFTFYIVAAMESETRYLYIMFARQYGGPRPQFKLTPLYSVR
ncbi:hypothetical protein K450DRAFT_223288 [Umbelopsis ramanniana AG]|uniref:Uncharacterized protein n=1 Tax=Umbelopsis ramanniana AG TaxID=1314678 RepID=A0AAD5EHL0_UMBRA|nr:uncharacterized protein K450DRAFT_223288 [Umbelopsis ramanniana AG]KAI8583369.1 hypothetical protein K450DRAFT_223288 [Umbelopsis ramanniana AG]